MDHPSPKSRSTPKLDPNSGPNPNPDSSCGSEDRETSRDCGPEKTRRRQDGPGPSCLSIKSHQSKDAEMMFKRDPKKPLICESVQSDHSKGGVPNFKTDPPEDQRFGAEGGVCRSPHPQLDTVFKCLKEQIIPFVNEQLQSFHRLLSESSEREGQSTGHSESTSEREEERSSREAVLNITLDFLKRMEEEQLAECLRNKSTEPVCRKLKSYLQQRFSQVFEGVAKAGNSVPLPQMYTELHVTEASEVNLEHEAGLIEKTSRRAAERVISPRDIVKPRSDSTQPIRTVLTKGVAGVGKTWLTQKFSLNWAEGEANQHIDLLFPFTFRELNVLKDGTFSLVELLHHCFGQTKDLYSFNGLQVLFIFDGLDECRLPLDFSRTRVLTDPTERASVEELLVNLIRGSLFPSAHIWITTRHAAANQIPAWSVSMVTEIRGFNDLQKDQYFMKRFKDKLQATAIIKHIKKSYILYNMCYIPIFGWILSVVIQKILKQTEKPDLPKTLTEMYMHFLVVQAKVKNIKYHDGSGADLHWTEETKEMVWSLGKLAFEQLLKGNLIFYERDMIKSGLDAAKIARYSGVFTELFREESGLYQNKVYCFIHLTVQEFLAALHVHQIFYSTGVNVLSPQNPSDPQVDLPSPPYPSDPQVNFYRCAVDCALQCPNGDLDLFLRFLLGLSLPTNQKLLQGLLTQTGSEQTNQETVVYIKQKLNEDGVSSERSMNLLHCLNELKDHSLLEEIEKVLKREELSNRHMSPADWSALSFILLSSDSDLKEFDLRKYQRSDEALLGLLPVLKSSTKATFHACNLTENICAPVASVLISSSLKHLDLSNNDLQDSGVEQLCSGLKSAPYRLETLNLSGCLVSEKGGTCLATALSSSSSTLRELDLSYNNPGASAELLTALRSPERPLETLRLDPAGERFLVPGLKKYSIELCLDPNTAHKDLLLSEDRRTASSERKEPSSHEHIVTDQVLSSPGLGGRCYWEVNWSGEVDIAVSSRGNRLSRASEETRFGDDDQSWSLRIRSGQCSVSHNSRETKLSHLFEAERLEQKINSSYYYRLKVEQDLDAMNHWRSQHGMENLHDRSSGRVYMSSGRVGVFLDSEAGSLSFYEFETFGKRTHLHTFISSFSGPLFPGFGLGNQSKVSLVKPLS